MLYLNETIEKKEDNKKMRKKLSVALLTISIILIMSMKPINAGAPITGIMELEYNLAWPGPQAEIPDWIGTITIDGKTYGMAFFAIGSGKPWDEKSTGSAFFFGEIWEIYESIDFKFKDGVLKKFRPGDIVLKGTDEGLTNLKNSNYGMNGIVEKTNQDFANWLGHNVHMSGVIEWQIVQTPEGPEVAPFKAPGTFHLT